MKRYTFEVTVDEQSDEWWETVTAGGRSACDDVREFIKTELEAAHLEVDVKLTDYEDK